VGGLSFYQRREIKDILAFMRMVQSGADYVSFIRTLNIPKRGLGEATIEKIRDSASKENLSILAYSEALVEGQALGHLVKLSAKQKEGLKSYVRIIQELRSLHKSISLYELVKAAIEKSGYFDFLREDQETYDDRKENLNELLAKAAEWEEENPELTLESFLEELSLKSSLDESEGTVDRVSLMTIHNGKGLEYNTVFVVGLEEELFPHINSKESFEGLEEERRLCYVGITRAKEHLYLSHVQRRFIWGSSRSQRPSRFLREIPEQFKEDLRRLAIRQPVMKEEEPFSDEIGELPPCPFEEPLQVGNAVLHQQFGVGLIKSVYETSAGLTYKIHFSADDRERSIVAKYAKLDKL
jgi:DNA helicase-2/ATP-dependent DNA helicase PcrA